MIGPDLLALTDRSAEALLIAVLDPNRAVEPRFVEYSAVTRSGRVYAGIIAAETGNGVTLIDAQGASHALLRSDLDELVSTGKSLMPVGAEELLNQPQDLLDLIAYVRSVESDPYGTEADVKPPNKFGRRFKELVAVRHPAGGARRSHCGAVCRTGSRQSHGRHPGRPAGRSPCPP